jgi:DNA-binding NarL/FixJ family response regulator
MGLALGRARVSTRPAELTPKTVRNYVSAILAKLQVVDRAQAVLRAREAGLWR